MKFFDLTLIVPSNSDKNSFNFFLENMTTWNSLPREVIFVITSKFKIRLDKFNQKFFKKKKIKLLFLYYPNLFPGSARNIGIKNASYKIVSFLDIGTHATSNWLENGYYQVKNQKNELSWGNTFYLATSHRDKIIRASTFGEKAIQTLPGSTMSKKIFETTGIFLENIRAGEDAEWMYRVHLHKIKSCKNLQVIQYQNLIGVSYYSIIKKWFRNYSFSRRLSYLNNNRENYFIAFSLFLILVAFNWNQTLTEWGQDGYEDNPIYIPHITKVTIMFVFLTYFFLRGVYLPLKKKVNIKFLLPITMFKVFLFSLFIDLTKLFSFFYSRFRKN